MPKGLTFLSAVAVCATLALPAAAETPDAGTVVARVNGEEITVGHMIVARASLPQQYQQLPVDTLYDAILDQLIQQSALQQSLGGTTPRHVELALDNERRSLLAAEAIEGIMATAASDADIQAAYDAEYGDGFGADEFNASHILVETEDEARALKAELDAGADFAELAKAKSTGPSGPSGGALGWFELGRMVPKFEDAVAALEPGQVSGPVQTKFGWHVILLNETRKTDAPALETVREDIAARLRQEAVKIRIDELVGASSIDRLEVDGLDPMILQDLDLVLGSE